MSWIIVTSKPERRSRWHGCSKEKDSRGRRREGPACGSGGLRLQAGDDRVHISSAPFASLRESSSRAAGC